MRGSDSTTTAQQRVPVFSRRRALSIGTSSIAVAASMGLWAYPRPASAAVGSQSDWRACVRCDALFFDGFSTMGVCTSSGLQHQPERGPNASVYSVHYDSQKLGSNVQYDWRFCNKCFAMFWDGDPNKGHCAAGGGHVAQGYMFGLSTATSPAAVAIRPCSKCHEALVPSFAPDPCAAGGYHDRQGLTFNVPVQSASTADCQWNLPQMVVMDGAFAHNEFHMRSRGWLMSLLELKNVSTQVVTVHGAGPNGEGFFGDAAVRVEAGATPNFSIGITWRASDVPDPTLRRGWYIGRIASDGRLTNLLQFNEKNPEPKVPWTAEPDHTSCVYNGR